MQIERRESAGAADMWLRAGAGTHTRTGRRRGEAALEQARQGRSIHLGATSSNQQLFIQCFPPVPYIVVWHRRDYHTAHALRAAIVQIDSLYEEVLLESPDSLPSPSVSSQCSHTLVWFVAAGNRRQFRLLFVVLHVPFSGDAELGDFSMKAIGRVASYIVSWRCLG